MSTNCQDNACYNESMTEKDYMIRAMAAGEELRAFAITGKNLTEEARKAHGTLPVATAALGRTMNAALMMATMLRGKTTS